MKLINKTTYPLSGYVVTMILNWLQIVKDKDSNNWFCVMLKHANLDCEIADKSYRLWYTLGAKIELFGGDKDNICKYLSFEIIIIWIRIQLTLGGDNADEGYKNPGYYAGIEDRHRSDESDTEVANP